MLLGLGSSPPASEKQLKLLRDKRIYYDAGITKGEAAEILSQTLDEGVTEKQIYLIRKCKLHSAPELLTKKEAMQLISDYKNGLVKVG